MDVIDDLNWTLQRTCWISPVRHTSRTNELCNIECIIIIILDRSPKILSDILSD